MREVVLSDDKERTASFECLKYEKNGEANMRKRYESWIWAGIIFS